MSKIRSFLFSLWFLAVTVFLALCGLPAGLLPQPRLITFGRLWGGAVIAGMWICGMRVKIDGLENLPQSGPMLIASQHQSAFDTMLWFRLVPDCRYVMKAELLRIPVFGWLARRSQQIPVERGAGAATMRGLFRDAKAAWANGAQVLIFPEGTRAIPGAKVEVKVGFAALAVVSKLPVIPVTTDSGVCWGKGMFGKRPGIIHVRIHPPLPTGLSRETLMQEIQRIYEESAEAFRAAENPVDNSVH